jgi:hypothetical protein
MTNVWPPHGSRLGLKKIFETIEKFKATCTITQKKFTKKTICTKVITYYNK